MKLEGIPNNINANHNHNVVLEVKVDEYAVDNIVDAVQAVTSIAVTAYAIKKVIDFAQRGAFEVLMRELWKAKTN